MTKKFTRKLQYIRLLGVKVKASIANSLSA